MAVTKTKFINYTRCPRYVALDDLRVEKLTSDVTFEEYKEEERKEMLHDLLGNMIDEDGNDILVEKDEQLEVMLPYYNEVELLAGYLAKKYFKGKFKFAYDTRNQESFDCNINGIRYICYTDIYNEVDDYFNIIEVKATTSKKFLKIGKKIDGVFESVFIKKNGIYYLKDGIRSDKTYNRCMDKLFDRYDDAGHYVYDLAVQRYIIENDLKQNNEEDKISKIKYYLAVLNGEYIYDGYKKKGKNIYNTDMFGNDIITYFDMTEITKEYQDIIDYDRKKLEKYIDKLTVTDYPIGEYCENKKSTKCYYQNLCWCFVPKENSILNYIDSHHGFKDEKGNFYDRYDLINSGTINMTDLPVNCLNREKNRIQREVVETKIPYMNKNKIRDGIKQITYPIYHLDFETFPCPLPRYKGESPYTQSVFQFSLHIEKEEGICDKESNHYGYLATNHEDQREELIEMMLKHIDVNSGGKVLVYNESFEKSRLKELADIFPEYKNDLLKLRSMVFDLLNITKTKTSLYEELGYDKEEAALFNYYHEDMNGSFSIKKILPLFSDLTYKGMDIGNGVQALVTYAKFPNMNKKEYKFKYQKLVEYCKQDTWAMVEILRGLRSSVK